MAISAEKGILFEPQGSEVEMHVQKICMFIILSICLFLNVPAAFAEIGNVLEVNPGATLSKGGRSVKLRAGMSVDSGDIIRTNGTGIVQLVFTDQTKIAVGPNATMALDVSLLRGGKRANSFTVKALGGSFRFVSGNSKKSAYKITTPTATMGIRGTVFDFWVLDKRQTSLALLDGSVSMCGSGGCQNVKGTCALVATSPQGKVAALRDIEEAKRALNKGFPFILSQQSLREPLRTSVTSCGKYLIPPSRESITKIRKKVKDPIVPPPPPPPPPQPPTPPLPDPEQDPSDFPGQSGSSGPSQGHGNSVSVGQHGTGTGNGQGAQNRGGRGNGHGIGRRN